MISPDLTLIFPLEVSGEISGSSLKMKLHFLVYFCLFWILRGRQRKFIIRSLDVHIDADIFLIHCDGCKCVPTKKHFGITSWSHRVTHRGVIRVT